MLTARRLRFLKRGAFSLRRITPFLFVVCLNGKDGRFRLRSEENNPGLVRISYTVKLGDCERGKKFEILSVRCGRRDAGRLWRTGICPKACGEIVRRSGNGDTVLFVNGALIGLSAYFSDLIEVKEIE